MDREFLKRELREIIKEENQALIELALNSKNQLAQTLPERKHLTRDELLQAYKISDRTLINWMHAGLKTHKVGGKTFFQTEDIEDFIKRF